MSKAQNPNVSTLQPIETAPKNTYVLVFGPSGYNGTPLRAQICKHDAQYRPLNPWVSHSGDAFTDGGEPATHWMPLPFDSSGNPLETDKPFFSEVEIKHAEECPAVLRSVAGYHDFQAAQADSIGFPFSGTADQERSNELNALADKIESEY